MSNQKEFYNIILQYQATVWFKNAFRNIKYSIFNCIIVQTNHGFIAHWFLLSYQLSWYRTIHVAMIKCIILRLDHWKYFKRTLKVQYDGQNIFVHSIWISLNRNFIHVLRYWMVWISPITNHQSSITNLKSQITNPKPQIPNHKSQITNHHHKWQALMIIKHNVGIKYCIQVAVVSSKRDYNCYKSIKNWSPTQSPNHHKLIPQWSQTTKSPTLMHRKFQTQLVWRHYYVVSYHYYVQYNKYQLWSIFIWCLWKTTALWVIMFIIYGTKVKFMLEIYIGIVRE